MGIQGAAVGGRPDARALEEPNDRSNRRGGAMHTQSPRRPASNHAALDPNARTVRTWAVVLLKVVERAGLSPPLGMSHLSIVLGRNERGGDRARTRGSGRFFADGVRP